MKHSPDGNADWTIPDGRLASELSKFVKEFRTFTPELFAEVKFHLLRRKGLTKESRNKLCKVSIAQKLCTRCQYLYVAKRCLLWYELYRLIEWKLVERAPPCIRLAFVRRRIKIVADYMVAAGLITLAFYPSHIAPICTQVKKWGLCQPNEYCKVMRTSSTLEYISAREKVKLSKPLHVNDV